MNKGYVAAALKNATSKRICRQKHDAQERKSRSESGVALP